MNAAAEGEKIFLSGKTSFAGLVPLDQVTLLAIVHPRLWRLALHLGGSVCIAVVVKSLVRGRENEARGWFGQGIVRCDL